MSTPSPAAGDRPEAGDERDLVRAATAGDQDAFRRLWGSVERQSYGLCLRLTGNAADAADALQDTQLAVWRNLHRFEGHAPFGAWVNAIARNAARAVLSARVRRAETGLDTVAGPERHVAPDFADSSAELLDTGDALSRLPTAYREALLLWVGGLTYDQVAAVVDVPAGTVRVRVHRARSLLRDLVRDPPGH